MSGILSSLKGQFRSSKLKSRGENSSTTNIDSKRSRPSTSKSKSKIEDLGLLELAPGTDPIVDIVAIHGLDGHRERTWTAENGTMWLRDLLPTHLTNARVLTYGYDGDTRSKECVSTHTIRQHAEGLLKDLSRLREGIPQRPIIFVAHSLGGIILKQSIGICNTQGYQSKTAFRDILVSTHAIVFFGTPHSGTNGVELLRFMNRLASVFMKRNDTILKHLKANSPELDNIQKDYLSASENIGAKFFYEEYATPIVGGRREMIVPRHSATLAGADDEALHADHCQMVKIAEESEETFKKILFYIQKRLEDATEVVAVKSARENSHRGQPHLISYYISLLTPENILIVGKHHRHRNV